MKKKADLLGGWIRKGQSDMLAMTASLEAGALDACCFHAQQAAEKLLKAYLLHKDAEFPFTHNQTMERDHDPKISGVVGDRGDRVVWHALRTGPGQRRAATCRKIGRAHV